MVSPQKLTGMVWHMTNHSSSSLEHLTWGTNSCPLKIHELFNEHIFFQCESFPETRVYKIYYILIISYNIYHEAIVAWLFLVHFSPFVPRLVSPTFSPQVAYVWANKTTLMGAQTTTLVGPLVFKQLMETRSTSKQAQQKISTTWNNIYSSFKTKNHQIRIKTSRPIKVTNQGEPWRRYRTSDCKGKAPPGAFSISWQVENWCLEKMGPGALLVLDAFLWHPTQFLFVVVICGSFNPHLNFSGGETRTLWIWPPDIFNFRKLQQKSSKQLI